MSDSEKSDSGRSDSGWTNTPGSTVERAADVALRAAEASLAGEGATLQKMYVVVCAAGVRVGELDCAAAGQGYEDGRDLFVEVLGHVAGMGKRLGLRVDVIPDLGPQGQG